MVAVGLAVAALLGAVSTARAGPVIYVLPPGPLPPAALREPFALGLYVPGAGGQITRESTIASLVRGKVENALLGGKPGGKPIAGIQYGVAPAGAPRPIVYVQLPPPGRHHNTKRYRVVFVGGGYRGILTSGSTRIRGLVSVADLAPSLVDLRAGRTPTIRSHPDHDTVQDLRELDTRLARVHNDRGWVYVVVDDPDAHCERARAAGAAITTEVYDTDYGSREYAARDLEGNVWSFGTYRPAAEQTQETASATSPPAEA